MSWMVWQVSQETRSTRMGQRGTFSLPGGSKYFSTGNKTQLLLTTIEHVNYPPPQERDMESSSHTAKLSQRFFLWGEAHTREAFFHLFKYIKKMFLQCCVDFYHTMQVSHNHTSTPSLPSRSSECQLLTSYPSCLYAVATFSIHPTLSLPPSLRVHKSILCNSCVFIPSLQIASSIPLFKVPYRHINIFVFLFLPHFTLYNRF